MIEIFMFCECVMLEKNINFNFRLKFPKWKQKIFQRCNEVDKCTDHDFQYGGHYTVKILKDVIITGFYKDFLRKDRLHDTETYLLN